jgi:hypothetical protein
MKIAPVKQYKAPEYPIQDMLAKHPELLKYVPKRWANAPVVLSALSLACFILSARDSITAERTSATAGRVAPIFHHGEGRGAMGCEAVVAPMFLSEDEARQVINEEAEKFGLHFKDENMAIRNVDMPIPDELNGVLLNARTNKPKTRKATLRLEGTDIRRKVSYEYVSKKDLDDWEIEESKTSFSGTTYDFHAIAAALQEGLKAAQTNQSIGIFYDPCVSYDNRSTRAKTQKQADQNLREQVRDFLGGIQMGSGFMIYRPSPEGAPMPLLLRPSAALGEIKALFSSTEIRAK